MDLVDVIEQYRETIVAAMGAITLYLSIVSGYLIAAHTAGNTLSRFQAALITILFLAFSLFFTVGSFGFFMSAYGIVVLSDAEGFGVTARIYAFWIAGAQLLGIIGSLVFMYEARRK